MDNIIKPYQESESESSEYEGSSEEEILSGNLGIQYGKNDLKNVKLMDGTNANDYEALRNRFFTSPLTKIRILYDKTGSGSTTETINLQKDYGIECKNVIGFRLLRYSVKRTTGSVNSFADLAIPEIPHKVCKIKKGPEYIIYRMTLLTVSVTGPGEYPQNGFYTDEINDEVETYYFNPINLKTITMNLSEQLEFTFEFEITMLNL
jgi:hypothetical protein